MTDITPELIAELRRLEKAATQGPWEAVERGAYADFDGNSRVIVADDMRVGVIQTNGEPDCEANSELVAAARNALPGLLDEVERLRERADTATTMLGLQTSAKFDALTDASNLRFERDNLQTDLTTACQRIEALEQVNAELDEEHQVMARTQGALDDENATLRRQLAEKDVEALAKMIEERLVDYGGEPISDFEEPRYMFSCGELRKVVAALRQPQSSQVDVRALEKIIAQEILDFQGGEGLTLSQSLATILAHHLAQLDTRERDLALIGFCRELCQSYFVGNNEDALAAFQRSQGEK